MDAATRNQWVAIDVATDPVSHALDLARAHERSLAGPRADSRGIRDLVAESWQRSLAAGVAPEAPGAPVVLDGDELLAARARSPLAPVIDQILAGLSSLDYEARHVVAIGDSDANLLWVSGHPAVVDKARMMRFQEGAAWGERSAGTNAVGTAAALDHAVQIFSAEHLVAAVHPWTCSAAPIHDPETGELIGVVDLTAELRNAHPHTLSVAALAARAAEVTLRVRQLERAARMRERWETAVAGRRSASVLIDRRGRVIASRGVMEPPGDFGPETELDGPVQSSDGRCWEAESLAGGGAILWLHRRRCSRSRRTLSLRLLGQSPYGRLGGREERGLRSLELLAVLAMHPGGATAEQLALAVYGERGKAVTVRAQVHRLREHLGEDALATQPYRLLGAVDADWISVQRLVSEGRVCEALDAYPGPLLPASDAPAVREARAILDESLRRSILTSADPDLLTRWLTHSSGADDLAAARALVAVLPPGDPRRAAATATAAIIARRMCNPTATPRRLGSVSAIP
jgi:hypothetical protein